MNTKIKNRIKSLLWRSGAVAFVTVGAYILQVGDVWLLDTKVLVNLGVMAMIGLIVGEITKYLNTK